MALFICIFLCQNIGLAELAYDRRNSCLKQPVEFTIDEITEALVVNPRARAYVQFLKQTIEALHAKETPQREALLQLRDHARKNDEVLAEIESVPDSYLFLVTLASGETYTIGYDARGTFVFSDRLFWENPSPQREADDLPLSMLQEERSRIEGSIVRTQLLRLPFYEKRSGKIVFCKAEWEQVGRSFKARGVTAVVFAILEDLIENRAELLDKHFYFVTQTDGNHGIATIRAVALAIQKFSEEYPEHREKIRNIEPVVFCIDNLSNVKRRDMDRALEAYRYVVGDSSGERGAVHYDCGNYAGATRRREQFIREHSNNPAYVDHGGIRIMAGHASIGFEIAEQLKEMGLADKKVCLLVPVGAGGLLASGIPLRAAGIDATTVMVQSRGLDAGVKSLLTGRLVENPKNAEPTFWLQVDGKKIPVIFPDGIAVHMLENETTLRIASQVLNAAVSVDDRKALGEAGPLLLIDLKVGLGITDPVVGGTTAIAAQALLDYRGIVKAIEEAEVVVILGTEGNVMPEIAARLWQNAEHLPEFRSSTLRSEAESRAKGEGPETASAKLGEDVEALGETPRERECIQDLQQVIEDLRGRKATQAEAWRQLSSYVKDNEEVIAGINTVEGDGYRFHVAFTNGRSFVIGLDARGGHVLEKMPSAEKMFSEIKQFVESLDSRLHELLRGKLKSREGHKGYPDVCQTSAHILAQVLRNRFGEKYNLDVGGIGLNKVDCVQAEAEYVGYGSAGDEGMLILVLNGRDYAVIDVMHGFLEEEHRWRTFICKFDDYESKEEILRRHGILYIDEKSRRESSGVYGGIASWCWKEAHEIIEELSRADEPTPRSEAKSRAKGEGPETASAEIGGEDTSLSRRAVAQKVIEFFHKRSFVDSALYDERFIREEDEMMKEDFGIYGSSTLKSLPPLFEILGLKPGMNFFDVGHGDGGVCLTAAAYVGGNNVHGREIRPTVCAWSLENRDELAKEVPELARVDLFNDNSFGEANERLWREADVIYCYYPFYPLHITSKEEREYRKEFERHCLMAKPGAKIVVLNSPEFTYLKDFEITDRFGDACYTYPSDKSYRRETIAYRTFCIYEIPEDAPQILASMLTKTTPEGPSPTPRSGAESRAKGEGPKTASSEIGREDERRTSGFVFDRASVRYREMRRGILGGESDIEVFRYAYSQGWFEGLTDAGEPKIGMREFRESEEKLQKSLEFFKQTHEDFVDLPIHLVYGFDRVAEYIPGEAILIDLRAPPFLVELALIDEMTHHDASGMSLANQEIVSINIQAANLDMILERHGLSYGQAQGLLRDQRGLYRTDIAGMLDVLIEVSGFVGRESRRETIIKRVREHKGIFDEEVTRSFEALARGTPPDLQADGGGEGVVEDANKRYVSGVARWRDYEIEVLPGYYVIPHSPVLDMEDHFEEQYNYLREQVAIARETGLIPILVTDRHYPSLALVAATEKEDVHKRRPRVVVFDYHSDMFLSRPLELLPCDNLCFWRYGIEHRPPIISGEDLILASDGYIYELENLKRQGIGIEDLMQLVQHIPMKDFRDSLTLGRNRYYIEFTERYKRDDGTTPIIPHDVLYMLKKGVSICRSGSVLDAGLLTAGRPVVVSFDVDVHLTDEQLLYNSDVVLSEHEVAAVHICEKTSKDFELNPQAVTQFLTTIAAGTNSRRFVQNIREVSAREDEELIVAFDTDIGGLGKHASALFEVFDEIHSKQGLENLTVVAGSGSLDLKAKVAQQLEQAGKNARVVIVARQKNIKNRAFRSFEDRDDIRIVSVNDEGLRTERDFYDISVTHMIEDVLMHEGIRAINFDKPVDARPISAEELNKRNEERARLLKAA